MRRALCAVIAVLVMPASAPAAADHLSVRGGQLRDAHGRQIVPHGVNVVYKVAPYLPGFGRGDARRLRGWGMNAIRLGVSWRALEPARGAIEQGYIARVRKLVRRAGHAGLWVLVDMHQDEWSERYGGEGAPDWATIDDGQPFTPSPFPYGYLQPAVGRALTSFWTNREGIRSEYVRAYAALANALADEPAVIGYDAFNEPLCELSAPPCGLPPQPAATARYLEPFYAELVPAMRRADPDSPTFVDDWVSTDYGYPFTLRVPFARLGLSYHVYCGQPIRKEPCPTQERQALRNGVREARANTAAPVVTEFGATEKRGVLRRVVDDADQVGVGWLYWQYETYRDPTTAAASEGPDAESLVTPAGAVKTAKVRVLARPYPERIAGHGARWTYRDGRFTLRWTAARGADTVIVVPRLAYPHGFGIHLSGARIVRRAPLTIRGAGAASLAVVRR